MATETMMTKPSARRTTAANYRVELCDPPEERVEDLPELEAFLFDERGRILGRVPVDGGVVEFDAPEAESRLVKVVLGVRGMTPEAVRGDTALPFVTAVQPGKDALEMPAGWWEVFVQGQVLGFHGRVARSFGDRTLPICDGTLQAFTVDGTSWLQTRTETELEHFRDDLVNRDFGLPATEIVALSRMEGAALRRYLTTQYETLKPYFFQALPDWWYRIESLGEVPIEADGTFRAAFAWLPDGQPRPSLYFRIVQEFPGVTRAIYKPPIGLGTFWNYRGEELFLNVTDPEAICRQDARVAEGSTILFAGVGFDSFCGEDSVPGIVLSGERRGCYRTPQGRYAPYGGTLHLDLDVDLAGLQEAGVKYYRLSWCRGAPEERNRKWVPLTTPVFRSYAVGTPGDPENTEGFATYALTPAPDQLPEALSAEAGIFQFPEPGYDYLVTSQESRAYGIWNTETIAESGEDAAHVAGLYTVRLELFDESGETVTEGTPIGVLTEDPLQPNGYASMPGESTFTLYVDNRPPTARLRALPHFDAGTEDAHSGVWLLEPDARPAFEALLGQGGVGVSHWTYQLQRGMRSAAPLFRAGGPPPVGEYPGWIPLQDLAPEWPTVFDMLEGVPGGEAASSRLGVFRATLEVFAATRDGYATIDGRTARDTVVFAVVEDTSNVSIVPVTNGAT